MLDFLKEENNITLTENGAVTNRSSGSWCLDLFATIGALRHSCDDKITTRFQRAFAEDRDVAMKILFFARDIRGGIGERRVFNVIVKWLAENYPDVINKNLRYIPEFGRWDDLVSAVAYEGTAIEAMRIVKTQLDSDIESLSANENDVSLLAKWMPSINASSPATVQLAKKIVGIMNITDKKYRQMLSKLRSKIHILENYLRERDYTFDYSKQPSKAMFKYRAAFNRNDKKRYQEFLKDVASGKKTIHTGTLMPYDIIQQFIDSGWSCSIKKITPEDIKTADVTWNALEDFTKGDNAICVVDGSGSMYANQNPSPIAVALSLGIYFAERNKGEFQNHFITFSEHPRLVEVKGNNIYEKVKYCTTFNEVANTNLEAVFDLILNTAVKHNVPKNELPKTIYIVSDMEFDMAIRDGSKTIYRNAKDRFAEHGYELPHVVFWNVDSRNEQQPVTMHESGTTLVSGCSPRIFQMVIDGLTPYEFMMSVLNNERYSKISA